MTSAPVAQPRIHSRRSARGLRKLVLGVAGLLGFLLTWELLPALGVVDARFLPPATTVLAQLATEFQDLEFWRNVGRTMTTWFLGLLIATVGAVAIGTVIGLVPYLRRLTHTTVEFLRPIPSVALIPLAILMFGFQVPAALLIVVYASFWQVFVQVLYGVADVDTVARDTAKSFGLTRASRFRNLVLPTALPSNARRRSASGTIVSLISAVSPACPALLGAIPLIVSTSLFCERTKSTKADRNRTLRVGVSDITFRYANERPRRTLACETHILRSSSGDAAVPSGVMGRAARDDRVHEHPGPVRHRCAAPGDEFVRLAERRQLQRQRARHAVRRMKARHVDGNERHERRILLEQRNRREGGSRFQQMRRKTQPGVVKLPLEQPSHRHVCPIDDPAVVGQIAQRNALGASQRMRRIGDDRKRLVLHE